MTACIMRDERPRRQPNKLCAGARRQRDEKMGTRFRTGRAAEFIPAVEPKPPGCTRRLASFLYDRRRPLPLVGAVPVEDRAGLVATIRRLDEHHGSALLLDGLA